jgi:alpha-N-arabinofuranosidase
MNKSCAAAAAILLQSLVLGVAWGQRSSATVTVDASQTLKTIDKHVFGSNIEWINSGNLIWNGSLNAANPVLTTRTQALAPTLLRFPGGTFADYYHWRNGVGPVASRPTSPDGVNSTSWPNTFGLHEFMSFCRSVKADPLIQVNVVTGTASEAADWVVYSNSLQNSERAYNGSSAPFGIKYWEIGNEQYIGNFPGTPNQSRLTAPDYVNRLISYSDAMKAADSTISVGAVGGANFGLYQFVADNNWNATILKSAGAYIDFLAVHNAYGPVVTQPNGLNFYDIYGAMLAFPTLVSANFSTLNQQIVTYAPGYADKIKLAVTEWGPLFDVTPSNPYVDHAKTLGSGVFTASMLRTFLLADRVTMANFFQLTSPLFLGSINYDGIIKPSSLAMQLYTQYFGTTLISASSTGPTYNSVAAGVVSAVQGVPYVEAIASLSADRRKMYVIVINKNWSAAIDTTVQLKNFLPTASGALHVMTSGSIDANNGNDLPAISGVVWATQATAPKNSMFNAGSAGTVAIQNSTFTASGSVRYTAPATSVSVLEFTAQ